MNTLQHSTRWLGLTLACGIITFAVSVEAKKGGGGKPPPEPPPAEGPAYQLVPVAGGGFSFVTDYPTACPNMISDSGALVGKALEAGVQVPAVWPPRIVEGQVQYVPEDIKKFLNEEGTAEIGACWAMNESGIAVGGLGEWSDTHPWRAYLWLPDGTPVNLHIGFEGLLSAACDINNAGVVFIGVGQEGDPEETAGVIVPLDMDGDGEPDTWFTDVDTNGVNDLYFPIEVGQNFNPLVINEANQVLAYEYPDGPSYLLTPDFSDADGDGNPWFADVDGDGLNDLLVLLVAPEPGASAGAVGLNNLGQVVGGSNGHVVRWEFDDNGDLIVTDLGALPNSYQMNVGGISDSGRMAGTCRLDAKGRFFSFGPWWVIENESLYELLPLVVNSEGWSDYLARFRYAAGYFPIYYGINRYDWILGRALLDGSLTTFVAIPVEQP